MREDPWRLLSTWQGMLPHDAVFARATAAWIHGLDLDPTSPVEIVVPPNSTARSRPGLGVRRREIESAEVDTIKGLRATKVHRTLTDLSLQWPAVEALVAIDMAVRAKLTDPVSLWRHAQTAKGCAGAGRLRPLVPLAAPAESPMETRLRWLLIQAGLPRPEVQRELHDASGRFVGRADLYYPAARLVIEYDGANHRERLVSDDRRQNLLMAASYQVLRFTAADMHQQPQVIAAQVRGALAGRTHVWHQTRAS